MKRWWFITATTGRSSDGRAPALGAGNGVGSIPTAPTNIAIDEKAMTIAPSSAVPLGVESLRLAEKRDRCIEWARQSGIDLPGIEDWHVARAGEAS